MTQSEFLVVPTDDPTRHDDWEQLGRSARLERIESSLAELGAQIRERLSGLELEFLPGAGAWTVRSSSPKVREELVAKLDGLPVEVAPDDRFYAL